MSDTSRYLFFDTPQENIDYYHKISSQPLPEDRSSLSNRYNLCYLAYKNFSPELTKCHSSPIILKSLITGFTYYNIMPLLNIPQDFFSQHITFVVLFYIVSFIFFLIVFYFLFKYFSPLLAYIFGIFSFTAPFLWHFNRLLNYDSFLNWIGVLFAIFTYLYFKYEKRRFLFYLTLTFFVGTTIKGFAISLLPIFILLYFLIYIPHKKNINPLHYLISVGAIQIGTVILYLMWPYTWTNFLDAFNQFSFNFGKATSLAVFSLLIILPYFLLIIIKNTQIIKELLFKIKFWHIAILTLASIIISFILFPIKIYQTDMLFPFINNDTLNFIGRFLFGLPQLFFTNNIIIAIAILSGLVWSFFYKKISLSLYSISFSYFFFFILSTSFLYAAHPRYQFIVLSSFLLAGSLIFYEILQRVKNRHLLFFAILITTILFLISEIISITPYLYLYKNQIAPKEYYPATTGGLLGTLDALNFIQNKEIEPVFIYSNYEGIPDKYFKNIKIIGTHGQIDLNPDKFISFDYALFSKSGFNAMHSTDRISATVIYNLYKDIDSVYEFNLPRYNKPQTFLKKSIPLIDVNKELIKLNYPSTRNTSLKLNFFYFDKNAKRKFSKEVITATINNDKIKIYNFPKRLRCPKNIEQLIRRFSYYVLSENSQYLFINSKCNFKIADEI